MSEEEMKQQNNPNPPESKIQSAEDYVKAVEDMKKNYVPKELYEKSEQDRKVLAQALSGDGPVPANVQKQAEEPNIEELRKKFLNAGELNLSNAEYIKTALDLRKALIAKGEPDPFLPSGAKANPTNVDIAGAEKSAAAFQSWLDAATDPETGKVDEELFNAYLKKGIADDSPAVTARLRAAARKAH